MTSPLSHWLDSAVQSLALQVPKIKLFHEREIYSEYWLQNELSALLPWTTQGVFLVDRGSPLILPGGVPKYPDLTLQFDSPGNSSLYFIELKDLLTNAKKNVRALQEETAIMQKVSRELTIERWKQYKGKANQHASNMMRAFSSAPMSFCGMALGARGDVPERLPGFKSTIRQVSSDWLLGFYELQDPEAATLHSDAGELEEQNSGIEMSGSAVEHLSIALAIESARECEISETQQTPNLPVSTPSEARNLRDNIEATLRAHNAYQKNAVKHAKPWVWEREKSGGNPMTELGKEYGVEVRFSFYQKPVR